MPSLNQPQARFLALPHKFRAFVAGFGSGKTWVGGAGLCRHAWEFPWVNSGYFAPTYGQIRDIFYPTIEEVAHDWGWQPRSTSRTRRCTCSLAAKYRGTVICRSMDSRATSWASKIGKGLIDEPDVMKTDKAALAWRKIIARLRHTAPGLINGVDVTTTPEGFSSSTSSSSSRCASGPIWLPLYGLVQASTYENGKNLPEDYIPSLRASYPPQLIAAYLRGQFTNLTSGSVYSQL